MSQLTPEAITIIMFGALLIAVFSGYPMAILLFGIATAVGYAVYGPAVFEMFRIRMYGILASFILVAVPLFIFMGTMVEKSGVAEKLFHALYLWLGNLRGGLAIATILLGTILAACVGIIAASVVTMGMLAMPSMLRRGYDKSLAAGVICAGGSLGILIPPSIMLIMYGSVANMSVGKLFMAAFPAGLVLSTIYVAYILVRCSIDRKLSPPLSAAELAFPLAEKLALIPKAILPPLGLILAVLGSIFFGVASPSEAAGIGAVASALMALAYRKLTWTVFKETIEMTMRSSCMAILVGLGATAFTGVFIAAGGGAVITDLILAVPGGRWGSLAMIMLIVFVLGMFIDWLGIIFIMVPIITPAASALGFDLLWFGMMVIVNLQLSFITPPFAYAIFYLKGIAQEDWNLTTGDIIRGVAPYVGLVLLALVLFTVFPQIILWLPAKMVS